MNLIINTGLFTIWFTPIVFVASLLGAIKSIYKGESMGKNAIVCAISFWLIVVPIYLSTL
jgi:hypothetical protein